MDNIGRLFSRYQGRTFEVRRRPDRSVQIHFSEVGNRVDGIVRQPARQQEPVALLRPVVNREHLTSKIVDPAAYILYIGPPQSGLKFDIDAQPRLHIDGYFGG